MNNGPYLFKNTEKDSKCVFVCVCFKFLSYCSMNNVRGFPMSPAFVYITSWRLLILFVLLCLAICFSSIQPFQWFINEDMNKDTRKTYNSLVDDCQP